MYSPSVLLIINKFTGVCEAWYLIKVYRDPFRCSVEVEGLVYECATIPDANRVILENSWAYDPAKHVAANSYGEVDHVGGYFPSLIETVGDGLDAFTL